MSLTRRVVAALCSILLGIAALTVVATPAQAADCTETATNWSDLKTAVASSNIIVCLGFDATGDAAISGDSLALTSGSQVTLDLNGHNLDIEAPSDAAAVSTTDATLTIQATGGGSLIATGGTRAAGIGGNTDLNAGALTILSGTVTATGGEWAAGIGGGVFGDGNTITISGGTVHTASHSGAGIGGGWCGVGGYTQLTGGEVSISTAGAYFGAPAIGSGACITSTISGGTLDIAADSMDNTDASPNGDGTAATAQLTAPVSSGIVVHRNLSTPDYGAGFIESFTFRYPVTFTNVYGSLNATELVDYGSAPSSPDLPVNGYTLEAWHTDSPTGTSVSLADQAITQPTTFYASWTSQEFNISYDYGNGAASDTPGDITYLTGQNFTLPGAPSRANCDFAGWLITGDSVGIPLTSNPSDTTDSVPGFGNVTATAQWVYTADPSISCDPTATTWDELKTAMAMAGNHHVTLGFDGAEVGDSLTLSPGSDVTLDLNGHNLNITATSGSAVTTTGATLTIVATGGGMLAATGGNQGAGIGGAYADSGTSLVSINGGTIVARGGAGGAGIGGVSNGATPTVNISGGTITAVGGIEAAGIGSGAGGTGAVVHMSGGQVTARGGDDAAGLGAGFSAAASDIDVSGGMLVATGGLNGAGVGGADFGTTGTVSLGNASITATGGGNGSGIGGGNDASGGTIDIFQSTIHATGGTSAAGIGGGAYGGAGDIEIYGGNIASNGGTFAAGIGGGQNGYGGSITVHYGTVMTTGGASGAGIGSGQDGWVDSISIDSGNVLALGGSGLYTDEGGAGVGSGERSPGPTPDGTISVSGSTLIAIGADGGAGIGGGAGSSGPEITLSDGQISASGGADAAGIGGGTGSTNEPVTMSGGVVDVWAGTGGASIGSGYGASGGNTSLSGGVLTLHGDSTLIGSGDSASSGGVLTLSGEDTLGALHDEGSVVFRTENSTGVASTISFVSLPNSGIDVASEQLSGIHYTLRISFTYTVSFATDVPASPHSSTAQSVQWGGTAGQPRSTRVDGYTITGWHTTSPSGAVYDFTTPITQSVVLYASLEAETNTVTYVVSPGTASSTPGAGTYLTGQTWQLPGAPTRTGYTFFGWDISGANTDPQTTLSGTPFASVDGWGDVTATAHWTINSYTVTFNSQGGSKVVAKHANYNTRITAPKAPTRKGHTFTGWHTRSKSGAKFSFSTRITGNITLYASWK